MNRLAHWAHRLYPKYDFDDCLTAIEAQGKKKVLGGYMRKFRQGMLDGEVAPQSDDEDRQEEQQRFPPEMEMDEMDRMLSEEISRTAFNATAMSQSFDDLGVRSLDSTINSQMAAPRASSTLSEEQMNRIEENKRQAMNRLQQRKAALAVVQEEEIDMDDLIPKEAPKPALTEEQKLMIEENKRRAMEKLKQKRLNQAPEISVDQPQSEELALGKESSQSKTNFLQEDEEMEPLVYDSE